MSEIIEDAEGVSPSVAQTLKIIAGAMGGGLVMMAAFIALAYARSEGKAPTPDQVRAVNGLTTMAMLVALAVIVASQLLWRRILRATPGALSARVQTAYIVRLALREGSGMVGLVVVYIAAMDGVLRVYPAYWVNLAPFVLFLSFLATHWPSAEKLAEESREMLGENPSFSKK